MTRTATTLQLIASLVTSLVLVVAPLTVSAEVRQDNFVRTGNQYLVAGPDLKDSDLQELAKFDLLVLPAEAQNFNRGYSDRLRAINPDIIILAYVPTVSYNDRYWTDALHMKLKNRLTRSMELWFANGSQASIWPGTSAYNIANADFQRVYVDYVVQDVWSSGYWDGIFFDEVASTVSWMGEIDLDRNGSPDPTHIADNSWRLGYNNIFSQTRNRLGSEAIIITNGSSETSFQPYVNGRMFESFPTPWEGEGRWEDTMQRLMRNNSENADPDVFFINSNTGDTGEIDFQEMRFGLTSALLGGAFFGYDFGETSHAQLWTFDEYDVHLGRAVDTPQDELRPGNTVMTPSVWSRDFQSGRVVVNSTDQTHTIDLGAEFETINGTQDRSMNNGRILDRLTLSPRDGVVLLRPVLELAKTQFSNGSFVRIFNLNGERKRTGFFAYTGATLGGDHAVFYDLDNDGQNEIITANERLVRIHESNGAVVRQFYPYGEGYDQGINIAVGDLENDGRIEIVTGTKNGGGPHIRIFNHEGVLINPGFFAYAPEFRGGVQVALGDVDGDQNDDIVVGAGVGGGPHVRVFNKDGVLTNPGFFAYDERFRGGVNVAVGDVTGDGRREIITGPGLGGDPIVRVFNTRGEQLVPEFRAFESRARQGVAVAAQDLDGDGIADIMALTTDVFTLSSN